MSNLRKGKRFPSLDRQLEEQMCIHWRVVDAGLRGMNVRFPEQNWVASKHFPLSASQICLTWGYKQTHVRQMSIQSNSTLYFGKSKCHLWWKLRSSRVKVMWQGRTFSSQETTKQAWPSSGDVLHSCMGRWTDSCWNRHTLMQEPFCGTEAPCTLWVRGLFRVKPTCAWTRVSEWKS